MSLGALTHAATRLPFIRFGCRHLSTLSSGQKLDSKAFSKTLLLPKTSFPLWPDPSKTEVPFRKKTCDDLYRWQVRHARGPLFVLHDGPPYANGHLHIGHALNKILKDIINRYHVSIGDRVHYVPGWDCHGLPIENKALQDLKGDPHTLAPDTIRSAARRTAEREMSTQQEEFKQFGIMADWSPESTYRTLDHAYEIRQLRVFQQMVSKGLIYRHYRPVYYSPSSRSALAEAELVYKDDHVSHAVHVSFTVDAMDDPSNLARRLAPSSAREEVMEELQRGMVKLLVWTTTPWTLTANMGIAVHPDLTYVVACSQRHPGLLILAKDRLSALEHILGSYSEIKVISEIPGTQLVGLKYRGIFASPSTGDTVPVCSSSSSSHQHHLQVISAAHVTPDTGTGLVHCAPAHGAEDYQVFRAQGLLDSGLLCHVDQGGKFSGKVRDVISGIKGGGDLVGLEVLKSGSKAIVALLERMGSLLSVERFRHRYPYDWKTNEPVIVTATSQWFANLDGIKEDALAALENVAFVPPGSRNRLTSFVRSRSEWCISRQRVWGVPIPALHHIPSGAAILTASSLTHILDILDRKGVGYWWDGPVSEFVNPELAAQYGGEVSERTWRKSTDTMDVWFDSGTSWAMLPFGEEHGRMHRADVCLEGSDQHRGWFQSQLLTAVGSQQRQVERKHPLTVINGGVHKKKEPAYGTDATVEYWRDMSIGPTDSYLGNVGATKQKMNDQGLGNLPPIAKESLGLAERYVMNELYKLEQTALAGVNFANITLSSLYFDITKDVLYANDRRAVVDTLEEGEVSFSGSLSRWKILRTMTFVLAPVLPHLAEEIHDQYCRETHRLSFFTQKWTPLVIVWQRKDMESLLGVRSVVLALLERARGDKSLSFCPPDTNTELVGLLKREGIHYLSSLTSKLLDAGSTDPTSAAWSYSDTMKVPGSSDAELTILVMPATLNKCPRCWTYTRSDHKELCSRCEDVVKL
ncbi:tRNA synthetases class I-domain-containing protein [Pisolithus microcarpus]|nr:tRNA synthetases class I-domain-containing protein [Pisolithus microcarpus]